MMTRTTRRRRWFVILAIPVALYLGYTACQLAHAKDPNVSVTNHPFRDALDRTTVNPKEPCSDCHGTLNLGGGLSVPYAAGGGQLFPTRPITGKEDYHPTSVQGPLDTGQVYTKPIGPTQNGIPMQSQTTGGNNNGAGGPNNGGGGPIGGVGANGNPLGAGGNSGNGGTM